MRASLRRPRPVLRWGPSVVEHVELRLALAVGALLGREAADETQRGLTTSETDSARLLRRRGCVGHGRRREPELELPKGSAMSRVEQSEGADAVKAFGRHVLEEATKEFGRGECH